MRAPSPLPWTHRKRSHQRCPRCRSSPLPAEAILARRLSADNGPTGSARKTNRSTNVRYRPEADIRDPDRPREKPRCAIRSHLLCTRCIVPHASRERTRLSPSADPCSTSFCRGRWTRLLRLSPAKLAPQLPSIGVSPHSEGHPCTRFQRTTRRFPSISEEALPSFHPLPSSATPACQRGNGSPRALVSTALEDLSRADPCSLWVESGH